MKKMLFMFAIIIAAATFTSCDNDSATTNDSLYESIQEGLEDTDSRLFRRKGSNVRRELRFSNGEGSQMA